MTDEGVPFTPSWNKLDPLPNQVTILLSFPVPALAQFLLSFLPFFLDVFAHFV